MKADQRTSNATAAISIRPSMPIATAATGKLYFFPTDQATLSRIRQGSEHSQLEERLMLVKFRELSKESKAQAKSLVDELHAREAEARKLQEFGKSRKALAKIWDNPDDAEYNQL